MGSGKDPNKLETFCNDTMNLNPIVHQNILASPYFKSLYEKKTYHQIVDEIYNEVSDLEPFLKGTTVSTAFCLLYKLWTLRLTVKQIEGLIDHVDSPYIRGIGFLYLRHVCKPQSLWDWFSYYLDDEEKLSIQKGPNRSLITIGKLCRILLSPDLKYLNTILPRIPMLVQRELSAKILEHDRQNQVRPNRALLPHERDFPERERDLDREQDRNRDIRTRSSRSPHNRSYSRDYGYRRRSRSRSPRNRREYRRDRGRDDYNRDGDRRRKYEEKERERDKEKEKDGESNGYGNRSGSKSADEGDEYDRYERDRRKYDDRQGKGDRDREYRRSRTKSPGREKK